jgi:CheY-like chemotaxis protein
MSNSRSTILLVEDDFLTQLHARMTLEDAGHEVVAATDGEDALAKAAARPDIAALFTDIRLPGTIDGLDLATAIRATHPGATIVLTSGQEEPDAGEMPAGAAFMTKPYTTAQMRRALAAWTPSVVSTCAGHR